MEGMQSLQSIERRGAWSGVADASEIGVQVESGGHALRINVGSPISRSVLAYRSAEVRAVLRIRRVKRRQFDIMQFRSDLST